MTITSDNPPPITAPPGTVCRDCWHGLKGLQYGSVCPECGASIGAGMDPLWWGNGPIDAIKAAVRAARLAFWVAIGLVAAMGVVVALQVMLGPPRAGAGVREALISLFSLFFWACYLTAAVLCTRSLVRARLLSPLLHRSLLVVVLLTLPGAAALITLGLAANANSDSFTYFRWQAMLTIAFSATTLSTLLFWSLALRQAAVRIANTPLRAWSLVLIGCVLLIMLSYCYTAYGILQSVFWQAPFFSPGMTSLQAVVAQTAAIIGSIGGLGLAVLLVVSPYLLHRSLNRFTSARLAAD